MKALMIAVAVLTAWVLPKAQGADDQEKIQGTWKVVSALADGAEPPDAEQVKQARWVIDEQQLATELGGESRKASYTLDFTKEPRTIDIVPLGGPDNEKGKTFPCIYSLEGDTLKICMGLPGAERPNGFNCEKGSRTILFVLQRDKP